MNASPELQTFLEMSASQLVDAYASGLESLHPDLLSLTEEMADRTFEGKAGTWSCRVLLGHLLDAEIAFVQRMRRTVAEERPLLSAWQEDDYVARGLYQGTSISEAKQALQGLRRYTTSWLQSLPEKEFSRVGIHPVTGEQTVHTILAACTWHLLHHAWFLDQKMQQLL